MDKIFFNFTLPNTLSDQVSDWIQLTPAGEFVSVDGRGPFVADEAAILQAAQGRKLPVDINHAIDLKGTAGESSPAVGWVVELQSRGDGIWGRVEWTAAGKNAPLNKEYGAISPVLIAQGERPVWVVEIARASLCNDPALPQLKSLFSEKKSNRNGETSMDKQLLAAMGLPEEAAEKALIAAVKAVKEESDKAAALMSHLREVAGLGSQAGDDEVIAAFKEKFTSANADAASGQGSQAADEEKSEMARQLKSLVLPGVIAPDAKDQFIDGEKDNLLRRGISTFNCLSDGTVTFSRGVNIPIEKGAKIKLGGIKNNPVIAGRGVLRAQEWVASEITATTELFREQRYRSLWDEGEGELIVLCDTGQSYTFPDAFLTDPPEMTGGEGGKLEFKWVGGAWTEVIA